MPRRAGALAVPGPLLPHLPFAPLTERFFRNWAVVFKGTEFRVQVSEPKTEFVLKLSLGLWHEFKTYVF